MIFQRVLDFVGKGSEIRLQGLQIAPRGIAGVPAGERHITEVKRLPVACNAFLQACGDHLDDIASQQRDPLAQ